MKSQSTKRSGRSVRRSAVFAAAVLLVTGCDALTLDREPEVAHIELDSSDVSEVVLVTSRWFVEVPDPECPNVGCNPVIQLVEADTNVVSLPFTESYPFNFRLQFFAETYPTTLVPATLSMKVHLDDEEWYNDSRRLAIANADGERETLRFSYTYHIARLPDG